MPGLSTVPVAGRALEVRPMPSGLIVLHKHIGEAGDTQAILELLPQEAEALAVALGLAVQRVRQAQERG